MNILPKARTENLVEQNLEKETLIYDLLIDKAFNLNETSTIVYKACNGKTTFEELRRKHKFSDDFIYLALDELKRNGLLAKEAVYVSPFINTNRREVIKKVGLASMFVLPIISGLIAPKAINAASNTGGNESPPSAQFGGYCRDEPGGPFCDSSAGYFCNNNRCCVGNNGSSLPGETFSIYGDGSFTFYVPTDGTCDNPPDNICDGGVGCCSGAAPTPTNTCEIEPNYTDETETEIGACIVRSCTCTC